MNSWLFVRSKCTIQSHIIIFQSFLTSFAIFQLIYWFSLAKWPWNWKALQNELWKGWKLAWYHHFTDIACKKVERVTAKTWCTSCTKWTISFEVSGFRTKTHLLQRHFIFLTYFNSRLFVRSVCTIQSHIINFQPFLTSFAIFHAFTDFFS